MRILFLSPRQSWPTNSGAKLREYHLARHLAEHAELTVLAFSSDPEPFRHAMSFGQVVPVPPPQRYLPWKLLRGLLGSTPLPVLNYTTPAMRQALAIQLNRAPFDIVQIEGTTMADYVPQIMKSRPHPPLIVYDWHNIDSELMERYASSSESWPKKLYATRTARLLHATERDMLRRGTAHLVCSGREQRKLQQYSPSARIQVIGNGVDTKFFSECAEAGSRNRILFVGSFDYHANIHAAIGFTREIWPTIYAAQPHLRLTLVGANPVSEVRDLAAHPGVEVTGTVPDIRPFYREAVASAVPLKTGGGTRLKILEALAARVPVVSTAIGAEGIDVIPGRHIVLAETSAEWVRAIGRIVSEPGWAHSLAEEGYRLATQNYDWNVIVHPLSGLYGDLLRGRS